MKLIVGLHGIDQIDFLENLEECRVFRIITTTDAFRVASREIKDAVAYISPAAWNDIEFQTRIGKIKKEEIGHSLPIRQSIDVLGELLKEWRGQMRFIGFAAETKLNTEVLREKWEKKPVDLLVGTEVSSGLVGEGVPRGFGKETGEYAFFQDGNTVFYKNLGKQNLADKIFETMEL